MACSRWAACLVFLGLDLITSCNGRTEDVAPPVIVDDDVVVLMIIN